MHQQRLQWGNFKTKYGHAATWHLYSNAHLFDVAGWIETWCDQRASARPRADAYTFGRMA